MIEQIKKRTEEVAGRLAELLGEKCGIQSAPEEEIVLVELACKKPEILIGREGRVLDALQFIVQRITARHFPHEEMPAIVIDVNGYRKQRGEELGKLARDIAERVSKSGKSVLLQPMSAWERKIVHTAVKGSGEICTESEDTQEGRQVRIKKKIQGGDSVRNGK